MDNKITVYEKIISNIVSKNIYSQAYIIVSSDFNIASNLAIELAKVLICPYSYAKKCNKCNICQRISSGNFSELKIINPENRNIRKEWIIEIRNLFQTNSVEGKNQVYIINQAELLNSASANSILKFLEEPDSNTIAIFTTTNLDKMIPTIVSRCQILRVDESKKLMDGVLEDYSITVDNKDELLEIYDKIESGDVELINYKESIIKQYNEKENFKKLLEFGLLFYEDLLNYHDQGQFRILNIKYKDIAEKNSQKAILKKLNIILENLNKMQYNVNMPLFILNYFIQMGEVLYD